MISDLSDWCFMSMSPAPFCSIFLFSFCSSCWTITLTWLSNSSITMFYFSFRIFQVSKCSLLVFHSTPSLSDGCKIFYYFPKDIIYWLVFFSLFLFASIRFLFFSVCFSTSFHVGVFIKCLLLLVCNMQNLNIYMNCDPKNRKKMQWSRSKRTNKNKIYVERIICSVIKTTFKSRRKTL